MNRLPTARGLSEAIRGGEYRSDLRQQAESFVAGHKHYSKLEGAKRAAAVEGVAQRELLRWHAEMSGRRLLPDGTLGPLNPPEPSEKEIAERERQARENWSRAVRMRAERGKPKPTVLQRIKKAIGV